MDGHQVKSGGHQYKRSKGRQKMKILYVEDENLAIEKFKSIINEIKGIESLQCFKNSIEAIEYVKENPIDVAFLDIVLPNMGGIELGKRILETQPEAEIVFVSAYEKYALRAFDVGAIGYVLKPYSAEEIERLVNKIKKIKRISETQKV